MVKLMSLPATGSVGSMVRAGFPGSTEIAPLPVDPDVVPEGTVVGVGRGVGVGGRARGMAVGWGVGAGWGVAVGGKVTGVAVGRGVGKVMEVGVGGNTMAVAVGWGLAVGIEATAVAISSITMRRTSCSEPRQPVNRIDSPVARVRITPSLKEMLMVYG